MKHNNGVNNILLNEFNLTSNHDYLPTVYFWHALIFGSKCDDIKMHVHLGMCYFAKFIHLNNLLTSNNECTSDKFFFIIRTGLLYELRII